MRRSWLLLTLPWTISTPLPGQAPAQRIAALGQGVVRLSFAARRGVCGNGVADISVDDPNGEWERDCEPGPVRVSLRLSGGRVVEAHTYVGGRWRASGGRATDLGTVRPQEAAPLLLNLAAHALSDGGTLIMAAMLAESVTVWPRLIQLARQPTVPEETRKQAVFWLGQAAGAAAARGLDSIVTDSSGELEIRKQAVFALSQRPTDEAVPALVRIARSSPSREVRKSALFWLGQSGDPRALSLFEELLR